MTARVELDHAPTETAGRDLLDDLVDDLRPHAAAIAGGGRIVEATMSATASTWAAAADQALAVLATALARRGHDQVDVLAVEALTNEEADRRLAEPVVPDLVSAPEVAGILEVSRQRVHQLLRDRTDFPEPLLQLATGPLWTRAAVEHWAQTSIRTPGRRSQQPPAAAAAAS